MNLNSDTHPGYFFPITLALLLLILWISLVVSFSLETGFIIDLFLDIPSIILILFPTLFITLTSFSFKDIIRSTFMIFITPKKDTDWQYVDYYWHSLIRNLLFVGVIGTIIGCINMMQNLSSLDTISLSMKVAMLTFFYAVSFSIFVCIPCICFIRSHHFDSPIHIPEKPLFLKGFAIRRIVGFAGCAVTIIISIVVPSSLPFYLHIVSVFILLGFILFYIFLCKFAALGKTIGGIIFFLCIYGAWLTDDARLLDTPLYGYQYYSYFMLSSLAAWLIYLCEKRSKSIYEGFLSVILMSGLFGGLLGFAKIMINFSDPSSIGPYMATALLTVFYGLLFLLFLIIPKQDNYNLENRSFSELSLSRLLWYIFPVITIFITYFTFLLLLIALSDHSEKPFISDLLTFITTKTGDPLLLVLIWSISFIMILIGFGISQFLLVNRSFALLRQTQAQLVQSEKFASLGQLVGGVAHEINNPANFIRSNITPLKDYMRGFKRMIETMQKHKERIPESVQQDFDQVYEEEDLEYALEDSDSLVKAFDEGSSRIAHIVNDLREYSRGGKEIFEPFDLLSGIESTLTLLQGKFKDRIEVHQDYKKIPEVNCSSGTINQVLMNLLSNAAEAIEGEGNVWLTAKQADGMVTVSIRDDGKGIPKENLQKIFDPFFTTKPVGEGTGLGLSICHGIVERHNGKLSAESELGKGTTITLILPVEHTIPA